MTPKSVSPLAVPAYRQHAEKPDVGSLLGPELNAEDSSEGMELAFSAREFATSASFRERGATHRAPSPTEDLPDVGSVLAARGGFARRRPRRRAWVGLESEDSRSSAKSAGGGGGGGGGHQGRGSR